MSQHFINLIKQGAGKEIAEAVRVDPSVAASRDAQGISALMWAVYTQQPVTRDFLLSGLEDLDVFEASAVGDVARILDHLQRDALLVHAVSSDGWPPLHLAAAFGTPAAVRLLLQHGAHVHAISRNALRNQALNACIAIGGPVETARLLLDCGANVNFVQVAGYTPLHQAAANGQEDMVRLLLERGAHPQVLCDQGRTARDYAQQRNHAGVLAMLSN